MDTCELRNTLLNAKSIPPEILDLIHKNKWLQIWVPRSLNGLDYSFTEGLKVLENLAKIDGSLGWLVTLCSGANYFSRNLKSSLAHKIFQNSDNCFGGSGMVGGHAEKTKSGYCINGVWHFATGAPYLSHFTLNAQITVNNKPVLDANKEPLIQSFILDKTQVTILPNWKTMGLVATNSHSFEVKNQIVSEDELFTYEQFYCDGLLNRLSFPVFADFTLLVNYLGMAKHYAEVATEIKQLSQISSLNKLILKIEHELYESAKKFEQSLVNQNFLKDSDIVTAHKFGEEAIHKIIESILVIHPLLGIKAACSSEEINQVFRDFFTATQHKNFRKTTTPSF